MSKALSEMKLKFKVIFFLLMLISSKSIASEQRVLNYSNGKIQLGEYVSIFKDSISEFEFNDVLKMQTHFTTSEMKVPNLGISSTTFWIKGVVVNNSKNNYLVFDLKQPLIDYADFYYSVNNSNFRVKKSGANLPFRNRDLNSPNISFKINAEISDTIIFYLKIKSGEQILANFEVSTETEIMNYNHYSDIIFGIYVGIIVSMLLYNLFLFISIKDKIYLIYSFYIFFIGLTQMSLLGYHYEFVWPNSPYIANIIPYLSSCMVSILAMLFVKDFLQTKVHIPRFHKVSYFIIGAYVITGVLTLMGFYNLGYFLVLLLAGLVSFYLLTVGFLISRQNYRPAYFFLFAWSWLLLGIILFVLKDFGVIENNMFTAYLMPAGSAIEVVLLSFALADKINILKKEKEDSQAKALQISIENERLVTEQNIELEQKVKERTQKLELTNTQLTETLQNLQSAQMQLVESEKMSSLGQLTAGIAHEINNPINFVSANISPLKLDIQDLIAVINTYDELLTSSDVEKILAKVVKLKEDINYELVLSEIQHLLHGIEDGAKRTSEIVRGLKSFSHLDEAEQKPADINEGIRSTLVLLKNSLVAEINLTTHLANLPLVECFPGKMNQVFMNIISNAIQAVKSKPVLQEEFIRVTTREINGFAVIEVEDSGPGIPKAAQIRIFEPFYTTKPVGEGTGLGLSIVFNIIKKHNGSIELDSEVGRGTKFTIRIPIKGNPENITS